MIKVVGVTLKQGGKVYYFLPNNLMLSKDVEVIVETERGLQYGKVATDLFELEESKIKTPLNIVVKVSSLSDSLKHKKNIDDAREAIVVCKKLVKKNGLNMKIIDANFTFNRNQLQFYFLADARVDFRNLAKELANIYKTRIELRQIGIRDKAKEIGGLGQCGRNLCCSQFLNSLDNVTINMAKNQNLSLNPTKINGSCGRLLCCLKYEDQTYSDCRKCMPNIGQKVKTDSGEGVVVSFEILKGIYKVNVPGVGIVEVEKSKNGCC